MTQPKAIEKYVFTFPKDDDGNEIKFRFMLTLGRKLSEKVGDPSGEETIESRLLKAVGTLDGIDGVGGGSNQYTIEITVARTFNPDDVIEELKRRIDDDVFSGVIKPKLLTP